MSANHDNSSNCETQREAMVQLQLAARGIDDERVLNAMRRVPRERFLPANMREFAYEDTALPIACDQTISQPWVVASMLNALQLPADARVLDVGTGSGYAAAVLAEMAGRVYSIERVPALAAAASELLRELGYDNVEVIHGDGSVGWPAARPFDGIVVAAGAPAIPEPLKLQLSVGGRLVMPVGSAAMQGLVRLTRIGEDEFEREELGPVRFVPLIGEAGWPGDSHRHNDRRRPRAGNLGASEQPATTSQLLAAAAEPLDGDTKLDNLLRRIGDSRVVLIGEASHGSEEFYRIRARLTQRLIEQKHYTGVAVEADWPDAARVDHYVRDLRMPPSEWRAFSRFPTWMWRNTQVQEFVEWLRRHNGGIADIGSRVRFYGLDLYSMYTSMDEVINYLQRIDPAAARDARERYGCLTPWQQDPATYGRAAMSGRYRECESEVVDILTAMMERQLEYMAQDGDSFLDAMHNARLVANAEQYYRSLYDGLADSWNLRDSHMFDTLRSLLEYRENGKIVVWAHNSHIGDARATEVSVRGQHNLGQLCRQAFGDDAYLVGMGTHSGTVAAASDWGGAMEVMKVVPSLAGSWERLCHDTGIPAFSVPVGRRYVAPDLRGRLVEERPERAIGVIYRPATEWASHYFHARLGEQFDDYIWFDETGAVTPLGFREQQGMPDTWPFGL
ncbi:protein-L-isoaspartate(D-aspartate) O-methyltransferase [Kineobactrum salinum]|uniref:Protein-L-isoaspartate O-methyltransferase n=1 Tax=Kineobactrum salinum TaxID=2708301 RepID=A0A6C0TY81_9GAMM|nr:protein-L-isoaspartate(D-aspartate) O-methyltransferase [Kineobactrum salinum]QIB64349.1 protein-L-isoaspartate(D-aspartate) O-methyltransferase [Kineobactrum salinum]